MVIQHNLQAINANRMLGITGKSATGSTEKLSSGYQINRAADDAAGLAISEKMRKQIRGLTVGVQNTEDGISLCQVADGALAEVTEMLQRINELSVQSANGTNSLSDREHLQDEVSLLLDEIERIGETTSFNETKIFKGDVNKEHATDESSAYKVISNKVVNYAKHIQKSIVAKANGNSPTSAGTHTLSINNSEISIDGNLIPFTDIKNNNGNPLGLTNIESGTYEIKNSDLAISFFVPQGSSFSDIKSALSNMSVDISHRSYNASYKATLGLNVGTDSDNFLVAATHNLHADETGMWVDNYSKISWASMGVDISNIVGKTINFNDTESGVSIKIKCDDSTSDIRSLIYSINNGSLDIVKDLPRKVYSAGFAYTEGKVKVNISNYFSFDDALLDNLGFSESGKLSANVEYKIEGTSLSDIKCVAEGNGQSYVVSTKSASAIAYLMNSIRTGGFGDITFKNGSGSQLPIAISVNSGDRLTVTEDEIFNAVKIISQKIPLSCIVKAYRDSKVTLAKANYDENIVDAITLSRIENDNDTDNIEYNEKQEYASSPMKVWIQSGAESHDGLYLFIDEMNVRALGINKIDVTTVEGSCEAIDLVSIALEKVSANRSKIGAQQNRLEHTIKNESNIVENTTAAESQIRDTDMAEEMVKYSNSNVLQQAGQSMLAQANQSNQGILSLLQ